MSSMRVEQGSGSEGAPLIQPKEQSNESLIKNCSSYFAPKGIHSPKDVGFAVGKAIGLLPRAAAGVLQAASNIGFGGASLILSSPFWALSRGFEKVGLGRASAETMHLGIQINKFIGLVGGSTVGLLSAALDTLGSGNFKSSQFKHSFEKSQALNITISAAILINAQPGTQQTPSVIAKSTQKIFGLVPKALSELQRSNALKRTVGNRETVTTSISITTLLKEHFFKTTSSSKIEEPLRKAAQNILSVQVKDPEGVENS